MSHRQFYIWNKIKVNKVLLIVQIWILLKACGNIKIYAGVRTFKNIKSLKEDILDQKN